MSGRSEQLDALVEGLSQLISDSGSSKEKSLATGAWHFILGDAIRNLYVFGDQYVMSTSSRQLKPKISFSTPNLCDMELFLTYRFCKDLRWKEHLPLLTVTSMPPTMAKAAAGFSIEEGKDDYILIEDGSNSLRTGQLLDLLHFSYYCRLTPQYVLSALTEADGKPPFFLRKRFQER